MLVYEPDFLSGLLEAGERLTNRASKNGRHSKMC